MKVFIVIILSLLLPILAFAGPTKDAFIRDVEIPKEVRSDYPEIRNIVLDIFEQCPPSECLYVGFGQSPTAVLALISAVAGEDAIRMVPLSNVKGLDETGRSQLEAGFRAHFENSLPKPEALTKSRVLAIDLAIATGNGIIESTEQLKRFYGEEKVQGYALTNIQNDRKREVMQRLIENHIIIRKITNRLVERLYSRIYASLFPYGKFNIDNLKSDTYEPPKLSSPNRFPILVRAFAAKAEFDGWLSPYWTAPRRSLKEICLGILDRITAGSGLPRKARRQNTKQNEFD